MAAPPDITTDSRMRVRYRLREIFVPCLVNGLVNVALLSHIMAVRTTRIVTFRSSATRL